MSKPNSNPPMAATDAKRTAERNAARAAPGSTGRSSCGAGSGCKGSVLRVVAEVGGQPALGFLQCPALALRVVGDLVLGHPSDHEVLRLRVREVPAADRGTGPHRHRLGQLDAGPRVDIHHLPERRLLGVLRAGRVAGGRADSHVLLTDERLVVQLLVGLKSPELLANPLVHP